MKFCPECGAKVEGMKFCPECGNKLDAGQPTVTAQENTPVTEETEKNHFGIFYFYVWPRG